MENVENDIDFECAEISESMLDVSDIALCGRVTNAPNYSCSGVIPQIIDVTTPNISFGDESNTTFQQNISLCGSNSSNNEKNHKPLNLIKINLLKPINQQTIF